MILHSSLCILHSVSLLPLARLLFLVSPQDLLDQGVANDVAFAEVDDGDAFDVSQALDRIDQLLHAIACCEAGLRRSAGLHTGSIASANRMSDPDHSKKFSSRPQM